MPVVFHPRAILLAAGALCCAVVAAAQSAPSLRTAASFAILGGSAVRNAGATNVTGNLGVSPGDAISGFPPGAVHIGATYRDDVLARQAQRDAAAAYADLAGRACTATLPSTIADGTTLTRGVYCSGSVHIAGSLVLDAEDDANAVWIFRITGSLTTADGAAVFTTHGGKEGHVFWQVGGSATVGAESAFIGSILALTNITFGRAAHLSGRALARNGVVSLDTNEITLCCSPIALSPATLLHGSVDIPYSQTIAARGGLAQYTFSVTPDPPVPGLTLSAGGVLSGTPTIAGTYRFTVTATDAQKCTGTAVYEVVIDCAPPGTIDVLPDTLPGATVGGAYSVAFTADGTPPYTCSIFSGLPPPGLELAGCTLSGTPPVPGTFHFILKVVDGAGDVGYRCYTIVVVPCPIVLSEGDPPDGTACTLYDDYTFTARGGTPSYTFTVDSLPEDLDLSSTTGILSGTPAMPGEFIFTVTATDTRLVSCSRTYTMRVDCPVTVISPAKLKDGTVGVNYADSLTAAPCEGHTFTPYSLPPGLQLSPDGLLTGIPTRRGTYKLGVGATASNGCAGVADPVVEIGCPQFVFSPDKLPPLEDGVSYDVQIVADGANEFLVTAGVLPSGLTLALNGRLFGTPTDIGCFRFTVTATNTTSKCSDSITYENDLCDIVIETPCLPHGRVGAPYSETFDASGGMPPYVFTVASGSLPPGLVLSPAGELSGTPTMAGSFNATFRVTDAAGGVREFSCCTIEIHAASCPPGTTITLAPANLPFGTPGVPYAQAITPSGGTAPYTFSITSGALPLGLGIHPVTGMITGIPAAPDVARFTVTAVDANGCRGSRCYTLYVGVEIPTLSEPILTLLCVLLACAGWVAVRRTHG